MSHKIMIMTTAVLILCSAFAHAYTVDSNGVITVDVTATNPPNISNQLALYLQDFNTRPFQVVGLDGKYTDNNGNPWEGIWPGVGLNGDTPGDGVDELVAFSFRFPKIESIDKATLTLILTPHGTSTDQIFFADDWTEGNKGYGNDLLQNLGWGNRTTVTFDLLKIDRYDNNIIYDLSTLLSDGDLDVLYGDDAIIHSATLTVSGTPEPATMLLLGIGLIGVVGLRRKFGK